MKPDMAESSQSQVEKNCADRRDTIRGIASAVNYKEYEAFFLFQLQQGGYTIVQMDTDKTLHLKMIGAFHGAAGRTALLIMGMTEDVLPESDIQRMSIGYDTVRVVAFTDFHREQIIEELSIFDSIAYGAKLPPDLQELAERSREALRPFDALYWGDPYEGRDNICSVIDVMDQYAAEKGHMKRLLQMYEGYQYVQIGRLDLIPGQTYIQKVLGQLVARLCQRGCKVVLDHMSLTAPGYGTLRELITPYLGNELYINPI